MLCRFCGSTAKCITGFGIAIGITLMQWLIPFLTACVIMPLHNLQSVAISQQSVYTSILNFAYTYGEVISKGILITFLCGMVTAAITMMLSYLTKNRFATIIPVLLFLLGSLIVPVFLAIFDNVFLDYLFPSKAIMFANLFSAGNMYSGIPYFVWNENVVTMYAVCCIVYAIICVLFPSIMILHGRKHIVKNR